MRASDQATASGGAGSASGSAGAGVSALAPSIHLPAARVWRSGRYSLLLNPRLIAVGAALILAVMALGALALTFGTLKIAVGDVLQILLGNGSGVSERVVMNIRLPRVLTGIFAGAALGASGAVFQSISRNALGSPDVIGFTTGAATGAIAQIILFDGTPSQIAVSAVVTGLLTAAIVYLLSSNRGGGGYRLVLTGIGVGAVLGALNGLMLVKGNLDDAISANLWLAGSLNARSWTHVWPVLCGVALVVPALALAGRSLTMIEMGDDLARQLGIRVESTRLTAVFLAVLLAALATAAAGPIAFVALAAPQLHARLASTSNLAVLGSAAMGALLLILADLVTQALPIGFTVPIGRMTGVIGGVYLIWLLTRSRQV